MILGTGWVVLVEDANSADLPHCDPCMVLRYGMSYTGSIYQANTVLGSISTLDHSALSQSLAARRQDGLVSLVYSWHAGQVTRIVVPRSIAGNSFSPEFHVIRGRLRQGVGRGSRHGKWKVLRARHRAHVPSISVRRGRTEKRDASESGREIGGAKITRCKAWSKYHVPYIGIYVVPRHGGNGGSGT